MKGDYHRWSLWVTHKANSAVNLQHKHITLKFRKLESMEVKMRIDAIWYKSEEWREWEWRGDWKRDMKPWARMLEEHKKRWDEKEKERELLLLTSTMKKRQAVGGVIDLELTRIKTEWQRKEKKRRSRSDLGLYCECGEDWDRDEPEEV